MLFNTNFGVYALFAGGILFGIGYGGTTILPKITIRNIFGNRYYNSIYSSIMPASTSELQPEQLCSDSYSMLLDRTLLCSF
ncbi:hypothetical protein LAV79_09980 [Peribacillus butanolivorans]|uniref:hypothetical protein n=1 Tax=Peribacillus butanolivorans TaxID=421767 RepID=UPI0030C930DE